jgi:hypothetical protein
MKTYLVTLKYTAYTDVGVIANSAEEAEAEAWKHLERTADSMEADGGWELDEIEEQA